MASNIAFRLIIFREDRLKFLRIIGPVAKKAGPNKCWLWPKKTDGDGRGRFCLTNGNVVLASRAAYAIGHNGVTPAGKLVCHECDDQRCVNYIKCLFIGTHQDNTNDSVAKGRHVGNRKLTDNQVIEIYKRYWSSDVMLRELAEEFNVTLRTVSGITNMEHYQSVLKKLKSFPKTRVEAFLGILREEDISNRTRGLTQAKRFAEVDKYKGKSVKWLSRRLQKKLQKNPSADVKGLLKAIQSAGKI